MGNWLRDYSQAMDIAGLKKLSKQTILNLIMGLGFLAHGYATGEFEVTEERLGVCTFLPRRRARLTDVRPSDGAYRQPQGLRR